MGICDEAAWSVVLAGGKGERLRHWTRARFGEERPKQYCAFLGTRTLLQHTLDRAVRLSGPERVVTVAAREHWRYALGQVPRPLHSGLALQPVNRDTAAGLYLALTKVRRRDPDAVVVVFPADHFVYPEHRFVAAVRALPSAVAERPDRLVLLGVRPDGPEPDYGWIRRGRRLGRVLGRPLDAVSRFVEKPEVDQARAAFQEGALWNTMVMAGAVRTFWRLGWAHVPEVMFRFESFLEAADSPEESIVLDSIYEDMPRRNVSTHVLQRARRDTAVVELTGVRWSDWGRPERIVETMSWLEGKGRAGETADLAAATA